MAPLEHFEDHVEVLVVLKALEQPHHRRVVQCEQRINLLSEVLWGRNRPLLAHDLAAPDGPRDALHHLVDDTELSLAHPLLPPVDLPHVAAALFVNEERPPVSHSHRAVLVAYVAEEVSVELHKVAPVHLQTPGVGELRVEQLRRVVVRRRDVPSARELVEKGIGLLQRQRRRLVQVVKREVLIRDGIELLVSHFEQLAHGRLHLGVGRVAGGR
mmetsp:Transcript_5357/g.12612  ORF Transcript_5357/g.12612 Transcript_5357/m.12612 type:complete len:214 (+) Transcript_5357:332-973(+)